MAGAVLERQLTAHKTGGVSFSVANEDDDAEIRRLLRDNPMSGRISLSLEREPNFFADHNFLTEEKATLVAREGGRVVCVGSCSIRQRFVNGKPRRVGYLGGLRLDSHFAGRFEILRRGYKYFQQLQQERPAEFYFTSIASDNHRARDFLERGLPGMPRYEFISEFVTLMIPTAFLRQSQVTNVEFSRSDSPNELSGLLNEHNAAYQFAPVWSPEELLALHQPCSSRRNEASFSSATNSAASDTHLNFLVARTGSSIEACGALWDQREFKQIVVRGYSKWLATARPIFNAFSRLTRQPRLPAVGESLSVAFVSHLETNTNVSLFTLLCGLAKLARQRRIELVTLGFGSNDPRLTVVRQNFCCREYRSRLYVVRWPGIGGSARDFDNFVVAPEVALL